MKPDYRLEEKRYLIEPGCRPEGGMYLVGLGENVFVARFFLIKIFSLINKYLNKKLRFSLT